MTDLRREWPRADLAYEDRVQNLRQGGGRNGDGILSPATALSEEFGDTRTGGLDSDWFWAELMFPYRYVSDVTGVELVN